MNAATTGFIMIAVAFPVYLLWKGELPGYLKFMTGGVAAVTPSSAVLPASSTAPLTTLIPQAPGMTSINGVPAYLLGPGS